MNIPPNVNNNSYYTINLVEAIEISPQEHNFLRDSINYLQSDIYSRDIEIMQSRVSHAVELTPNEFITSLNNNQLPRIPIIVKGHVNIKDSNISFLPSNIKIKGTLNIENCHNIMQLPLKLEVYSLSIINCSNLIAIADDISIEETLKIITCDKISNLPPHLVVNKLVISYCKEISLPINIIVEKTLKVSTCPKVTSLPKNDDNRVEIQLYNLDNLTLENGFFCPGTFSLHNCKLTLAEDMIIGGDFVLNSCNFIEYLPNFIEVYGDIKISNCRAITDLPNNWFTCIPNNLPVPFENCWHAIELQNTSISIDKIEEYNRMLPEYIYVSIIIDTELDIEYPYKNESFDSLINIWQQNSTIKKKIKLLRLTSVEQEDLHKFLYKLIETEDYKNKITRSNLADRVINILQLISNNNLKEKILFLIHDAVATCEDRILLGLTEIEFLPLLQQAKQQSITDDQGTELKKLGKQQLYENEILEYAMIHANKIGTGQEEVEFILSYKIKLADAFNLNLPKITMNYSSIPRLTEDDIAQAFQKINTKVTDCYFEQWLNNWEPWQEHKRRWQLKKYQQLQTKTINTTEIKAKDSCIISGENMDEIKDLVMYNKQVYSYNALCKWYIVKGTDPVNPSNFINLNNIFAISILKGSESIIYKKLRNL